MIKRIADLLEKVAAGAFLIGLFQGGDIAIKAFVLGLGITSASLLLTWQEKKKGGR